MRIGNSTEAFERYFIFNDLEWRASNHLVTRSTRHTVKSSQSTHHRLDRNINGPRPLTLISRSLYYSTSNNSKIVRVELYILTLVDQQKVDHVWSIKRRHFQWPWTTPNPDFKVTSSFNNDYLRNVALLKKCHLEWPWVPGNQLTKYSMTRSIAQSLCDNWASCWRWTCQYACCIVVIWLPSTCADNVSTTFNDLYDTMPQTHVTPRRLWLQVCDSTGSI